MIFKMLGLDLEKLDNDTVSKLTDADLRYECYGLYKKGKHRNEWDENRLKELLNCPACQEEDFIEILKRNGSNAIK